MQKVSKTDQKLIKSLKYKKYRYKYGLFVVEGIKVIKEFLNSPYELEKLFTTEDIFQVESSKLSLVSPPALKSISFLSTPQTAVAVFRMKGKLPYNLTKLSLALDGISDPGNLGTIIRLCDWFGIKDILCSQTTVDCYNPKVVQSTMGSLCRVNIHYLDLEHVLSNANVTTYISDMEGQSVYRANLSQHAILVMGNESHGVSETISALPSQKLTIPQFGATKETESLNVAMATSILLSEFKRRTIEK